MVVGYLHRRECVGGWRHVNGEGKEIRQEIPAQAPLTVVIDQIADDDGVELVNDSGVKAII